MHKDGDVAERGNDMHGVRQKIVIWRKKEKTLSKRSES